MIRCAVVDDEELARTILEQYISRLPNLKLVGSFKSALLVAPLLHEKKIDVLFLDIQMPDITGTDFLKSLPVKPVVILTTAYTNYALEGFELDVTDYLVKPFSFERFLHSIHKASIVLSPTPQEQQPPFITISSGHKLYRLLPEDILYIEGLKEYVSYFTADGQRIVVLDSLKRLEQELPANFIRTHKSYIVNLSKVRMMDAGNLIIGSAKIPLGGSYKNDVLKRLTG